jgi:hypothetical protein
MTEKNIFGGANPNGLYVPLTEDEQEALHRLVERDDIELVIHGWATLSRPQIRLGDKRLSCRFNLEFKASHPRPVKYFDLELRTTGGISLYRQKKAISLDGVNPIIVHAGMSLTLDWDISIHHVNPELVKMLKPGAIGLTSRRLDRDTGLPTFRGNMKLSPVQERILQTIETQESR